MDGGASSHALLQAEKDVVVGEAPVVDPGDTFADRRVERPRGNGGEARAEAAKRLLLAWRDH